MQVLNSWCLMLTYQPGVAYRVVAREAATGLSELNKQGQRSRRAGGEGLRTIVKEHPHKVPTVCAKDGLAAEFFDCKYLKSLAPQTQPSYELLSVFGVNDSKQLFMSASLTNGWVPRKHGFTALFARFGNVPRTNRWRAYCPSEGQLVEDFLLKKTASHNIDCSAFSCSTPRRSGCWRLWRK